jgi:asparagine synthetase B (glutamine-hydrolysing)
VTAAALVLHGAGRLLDLAAARKVVAAIGTVHHEFQFTVQEEPVALLVRWLRISAISPLT